MNNMDELFVELGPLTVCRFELFGTLKLRHGQKQHLRIISLGYNAYTPKVTDATAIWQTLANMEGSELVFYQDARDKRTCFFIYCTPRGQNINLHALTMAE